MQQTVQNLHDVLNPNDNIALLKTLHCFCCAIPSVVQMTSLFCELMNWQLPNRQVDLLTGLMNWRHPIIELTKWQLIKWRLTNRHSVLWTMYVPLTLLCSLLAYRLVTAVIPDLKSFMRQAPAENENGWIFFCAGMRNFILEEKIENIISLFLNIWNFFIRIAPSLIGTLGQFQQWFWRSRYFCQKLKFN